MFVLLLGWTAGCSGPTAKFQAAEDAEKQPEGDHEGLEKLGALGGVPEGDRLAVLGVGA